MEEEAEEMEGDKTTRPDPPEAETIGEMEEAEETGEVIMGPGDQDTPPTLLKTVVIAITSTGRTLGTVWIPQAALGKTKLHHEPEGPAILARIKIKTKLTTMTCFQKSVP